MYKSLKGRDSSILCGCPLTQERERKTIVGWRLFVVFPCHRSRPWGHHIGSLEWLQFHSISLALALLGARFLNLETFASHCFGCGEYATLWLNATTSSSFFIYRDPSRWGWWRCWNDWYCVHEDEGKLFEVGDKYAPFLRFGLKDKGNNAIYLVNHSLRLWDNGNKKMSGLITMSFLISC